VQRLTALTIRQGCQIKIAIKSQTVLEKGQTDYSKARKERNYVGGIRFPLVQKYT